MTDSRDVCDKTLLDNNEGGEAFAALRPRARRLFVAYTAPGTPSIAEAADSIGYSHQNAREILRSDPFQAALLEWHTALHQDTRNALKVAAMEAARKLVERLQSQDEDVTIRAAIAILDRAGHAPKQEIDLSANVRTTKAAETPTEDLEAQLAARLAALTPRPDAP